MKIYTKTGDKGETGLFGGARVSKASERVGVYGEVDELNSTIGFARACDVDDKLDALLDGIQHELFQVGAELGSVADRKEKLSITLIGDDRIEALERAIDELEEELEPLQAFILPGGSAGASALHMARCVCRRAERALVGLEQSEPVRGELLRYLNRLSDFLFTAARYANRKAGVSDIEWRG